MSESLPVTSADDSPAGPAFAEQAPLDFDRLLGNGIPNTDNSPTIISKTPPTQSFINFSVVESSLNGGIKGRTLAHFELLEPIGVGGMAAVLRARDKLLDRFVALKILPPDMAVDPEHVQRFHQEARAAAKLDHENIARVYYCGEDQRLHFIAFEFVEGPNLRTLIEQQGKVAVKDSVHYMLQIATGLAHAASRGVVHRDIKPSNIIIMPNGRAKLVDMGLARSQGAHDNRQLTQSGVTLGTFDYISPEQALEPRDADVRSDIYSLGCTFYHMLTNQPPVPEGTAARKLHHHQYVAPIDPRQINPEIPDEVAAILQRMMAKDPKDRYQRAEHLVQHLIQVAQKIGGADVPDGVFFVDAPLPNPPRKRPLVLAAIGVAALALFVLAVSITTPPNPSPPLRRAKGIPVQSKEDQTAKNQPPIGAKDQSPANETRLVSNQKEFVDALGEDRSLKVLLRGDEIHLGETGLTYHGGNTGRRSLLIESEYAQKPATLQIAYDPDSDNESKFWAGLTIEGGTVTFRNVNFAMEAGHTPRQLAAGIVVTGGQVVFDHCTFTQDTPQEELISRKNVIPVASVAAWNPTLKRPPIVFRHCYFPGGQTAVSVKGSAKVELDNCAFGPHASLFHLWGQEKDDKAELFLNHVSAHVAQGPAFRLDDNVSCALAVQYSIFACPSNTNSLDRPDLIHQTGAVRTIKYEGKRNAYHQLMSFWSSPTDKDDGEGADWPAFKKRIAANGGSDIGSSKLKASPWARPNLGSEDEAKIGFLIDLKQPELRQENDKKNRPIGVEICAWGPLYPATGLQPLEQVRPTDSILKLGERLVDPSGVITGERVHKKIEAAISEAEPGDVILIKHNGELRIEPIALTENRRVKLRPYLDSQPILILGKTTEKTAALFHLHHSQIEFEHLEFLLRPDVNHRWLAVVSMGGDSSCRFEQCVLTLDNGDNSGVDLDAVTLLDSQEALKSTVTAPKSRAEVKFKSSFVRGRGDLLGVQASRPFGLELDSSLVCLAGSLVTVHEQNATALLAGVKSNVKLHKTTTYLAEPALHLFPGKQGRGLLFTQVNASNCLFAAAAAKPLVMLEGPDNDSQFRKFLGWTGASNAFAGFDKLLEQIGNDAGIAVAFRSEDWKRFTDAAADTRFDRAGLQATNGVDRDFTQLLPNHFHFRTEELGGYGAPIELLPRPIADTGQQNNSKHLRNNKLKN